jgi:hypothetical protein
VETLGYAGTIVEISAEDDRVVLRRGMKSSAMHGAELLEGAWTKIDDLRRLNLFAHAEAVALRQP